MKLTIKTLQQKQFQIEVEPEDTVLTLKGKVEQSQGYPVAQQKLIFSGKILVDDKLVSEYNATERDFMVVMVSKPKAQATASNATAPTPATPAPPAVPVQTPQAPTRNTQRQANTEDKPDDTPAPKPVSNSQEDTMVDEQLATGPEYEAAISHMLEMGFEREKITRAMRASFNNPDRAVEYLMNGIPEQPQRENLPTHLRQPQNLFTAAAEHAAAMEDQDEDDADLSFLTGQPQFQQLRQLVHQNPELLQPLLQQLGQANPELLQLINENQDTFFQLLSADNDDMDDDEDYDPEDPEMQYIHISQQEKEAIDRLVALGFDRETATEAYFACDKNEELAANYLFDSGF
ncbi:UV excision repair protein Rad23 [Basidiobolus meristosporus CBS 931.73]|uniref:UV excision repair protein RAD23 n=1 Tax=Basidiobolus meristosporus CBS 931.73 TaxID=1314790 RepID=A0A1Y1Y6A2_9FUNG|nr:UV excision repair protein Rad23 [Basidiobolus meristosporus CBS 931.73]|eukprot:ORX93425.1 UV excision repair protein Rad23 [Basidiobolus meristosporus CBS 931.73]